MDSKKIAESQVDEPWHTQFKITITWKHKLHTFSFAICYDYAWIVTHILCSQLIILVSLRVLGFKTSFVCITGF